MNRQNNQESKQRIRTDGQIMSSCKKRMIFLFNSSNLSRRLPFYRGILPFWITNQQRAESTFEERGKARKERDLSRTRWLGLKGRKVCVNFNARFGRLVMFGKRYVISSIEFSWKSVFVFCRIGRQCSWINVAWWSLGYGWNYLKCSFTLYLLSWRDIFCVFFEKDGEGFVHKSAVIELFYSEPWLSYIVWNNSASWVFVVTELDLQNISFRSCTWDNHQGYS